jgi:hypothetical protein
MVVEDEVVARRKEKEVNDDSEELSADQSHNKVW